MILAWANRSIVVFDDRVGVANPKSLLTVASGFLSNVLALFVTLAAC
jgi:hypothetical protein